MCTSSKSWSSTYFWHRIRSNPRSRGGASDPFRNDRAFAAFLRTTSRSFTAPLSSPLHLPLPLRLLVRSHSFSTVGPRRELDATWLCVTHAHNTDHQTFSANVSGCSISLAWAHSRIGLTTITPLQRLIRCISEPHPALSPLTPARDPGVLFSPS